MKKLLTILLTIIAIQANAQFKYNDGKATANMDTLGTRNDTLFVRNRVTGEVSYFVPENGETITTREKIATQIGDSIANKLSAKDTLLFVSTKYDDAILDNKISKLSDLQVTQRYYLDLTASDISTYSQLVPDPLIYSGKDSTVTINNNTVLIAAFATNLNKPNVDTIPTGQWAFRFFASISATTGENYIHFDVYKRDLGGTETFLFRVSTQNILVTTQTEYLLEQIKPAVSITPDDRLVVKVSAQTTGVAKTATFYYSNSEKFAFVQPPLTFSIPESDPKYAADSTKIGATLRALPTTYQVQSDTSTYDATRFWVGQQGYLTTESLYIGDSAYLKSNTRELLARTDTTQELVSRTIYVSPSDHPTRPGDDINGDGLTNTTAFATIYRALEDIGIMKRDAIIITIQCDSGLFYIDQKTVGLLNFIRFIGNKRCIIKGQNRTIITGIIGSYDAQDYYKYNVSSPTMTIDEYKGTFGYVSANIINPIESNTTNAIYTASAHNNFTSIITHNTTIQLTYNQFVTNSSYFASIFSIEFQDLKFTTGSGSKWFGNLSFTRCYMDFTNISSSGLSITNQGATFNYCYIIGNFPTTSLCHIICNSFIGIRNSVFTTNQNKTSGGIMVGADIGGVGGGNFMFYNTIFSNFSYAIVFRTGIPLNYIKDATYTQKFKNCGTVIGTRLDAISDPIGVTLNYNFGDLYLEDVDYLCANKYGAMNIYVSRLFGELNIDYINSSSFSKAFINNEIGQHVIIPGTYPEYQQNQSATLTDNSTDSISVGDMSYNRTITIDYNIVRSGVYRKGTFEILNDGTNILFDPGSYFPPTDIGVTLNGAYQSGGSNIIKLKWTTTSTGANATIKYDVRRQNF